MKKLTPKEEEIMQVLWKLEKAIVRELVDALPDPKPHYNTVSTMVKILEEKGFVDHEKWGNMYRFFPIVSRDDYQAEEMDDLLEKYFDSSYTNLVAHFAKKEKISEEELKEILQLIQSKKS